MILLDFNVIKISEESMRSLEDRKWVDDQMIAISFDIKQNEVNKTTDKEFFVSPSTTQLIRKSKDNRVIPRQFRQ